MKYNKKLNKIIELRKLTKFSIKLCKEALKNNKWNIDKSIIYLRNNEKKNKIKNKILNNGIVLSKKKNNIGVIIKIKTVSDFIIKNIEFINFVKKILNLSLKCKNITEILNSKIDNKIIKDDIIDKIIMFKENIIISDFKKIKSDYINYYNHHNNRYSSIIGVKLLKKIKDKKKLNLVKIITKNIAMDIIYNYNLYKKNNLNNYYNNDKIDLNFLKRINLTLKEYLIFFKENIKINNFYFLKI